MHDVLAVGAHLVCLCSSDGVYAERAVEFARALSAAGLSPLYLAGNPGDRRDEETAAGVTEFIHVGVDVLDVLRRRWKVGAVVMLVALAAGFFLVGWVGATFLGMSETVALSLYILTAFNKRNIRSAEAALKYFLVGGLSAAFLLFGLSWIYGMAGTTDFHKLAAALAAPALDPLLIVALVLAVIGFGFKVAAVPFHLWAPDAYQGAPTPRAAFIASGSKVASFFIFAKLMMLGFAGTPLALSLIHL